MEMEKSISAFEIFQKAKALKRKRAKLSKCNMKRNALRKLKRKRHEERVSTMKNEIPVKKHTNAINGKGNGNLNKNNGIDKKYKPKLIQRSPNVSTDTVFQDIIDKKNPEDSFLSAYKLLAWILSPKTPAKFFSKYWEVHPLYIKRNNCVYFDTLLTTNKLDKMLRENPLYFTRNVDIVSYENEQRQTHNPDGRAVPAVVWDFYSNGCSIRVLNPQTYNNKIYFLLSTLQEYFGCMVGANVYLTPPGSQGFAPHFDDIEAFVLQLEGRKHWKLYNPKKPWEKLARYSSPNLSRDELGKLVMEVTLEAGDVLYFPRGTVHEAFTDNDSHSLHLTVSVYQHTAYVDLLEQVLPEALKNASKEDIEFRQGLPLQYLRHAGYIHSQLKSEIRSNLLERVQKLMYKLVNYVDIDKAADQLGRKFMYDALPPVVTKNEKNRTVKGDGEYLDNGKVYNRIEFGPDAEVRLFRYHSLRVVVNENCGHIYYCTDNAKVYHDEEEQVLEIDMGMIPIIQTLLKEYPKYVKIESLPLNDDIMKIQVIAELWEKGLIVTKDSLLVSDEETSTEES